MSRVFLAEETSLGRKVVVKVLPPELAAAVNVERFRREIQLAARLQHPHIVPLLAAGISNGLPYYTMPFVAGESLRARLTRMGELPVGDASRIMRDVLTALSYAHEQGVVHRDIKPDNVLLSRQHAQVTDFGVAKALSASTNAGSALTSLGVALGTPAYMAPEQAAGDPSTDHRADLYAVAAMGYEMLTGYKVFSERSPQQMLAAHAIETPEPLIKRRPATPPALAALIMRGLEKRPADRPQSADEMLAILDTVSTPSTATSTAATTGAATPRTTASGRQTKIVAALIGALAVAAIAGVYLRGRSATTAVDHNLVVVAPFRVAGAQPSLAYLREGMLDLLAAKLNGEGGPRAADPRSVLSAWKKVAESSAEDLSENQTVHLAATLGAGQVILGGIVGTPERMVVNAAIYEVPSGRSLRGEVTVQGPADSLASLVDQLTVQLLSLQSGEDRQHLGELASASLPALREYLDGKAFYRRGRYAAATEHFNRAVEIDSTFALAAVALATSANWLDSPLRLKGMRLGWASKQKLSVRDQAFLLGQSGSDLSRPPTARETLVARENAVKLAPDQPEFWYELGDLYFHTGRVLGLENSFGLAQTAFGRALAVDSSFAPAIEHMVDLAVMNHKPDDIRKFAAMYLALDSAADHAPYIRWRAAVALGDSSALRALRPSLPQSDMANGGRIAGVAMMEAVSLNDADLALENLQTATSDDPERPFLQPMALAFNRGYRGKANALQKAFISRFPPGDPTPFAAPIFFSMLWDGDTAGVGTAVATFTKMVATVPRNVAQQSVQHVSACLLALWRLDHGDVAGASALEPVLQRTLPAARTTNLVTGVSECELYVRAAVAVRSKRADATAALDSLHSASLRGANDFMRIATNLLLARLYSETGDAKRALVVIRRRPYHWAVGALTFLSTYVREEGRLAAAAGDTAGSIAAYQQYLRLRSNAEGPLVPARDSVRGVVEAMSRGRPK